MKKKLDRVVRLFQKLKSLFSQRKAKPDEFINWLRFLNAGMLEDGNVHCFEYVIQNLPSSNPIIEIGSFCGLSTNLISFYLRKFNKSNHLITSDKWIFADTDIPKFLEESNITRAQYEAFVKETYVRNISFFSKDHLPYTIEQFSDDFFKLWSEEKLVTDVVGRKIQLGGKISFAYIDGNHAYEYAKRDFENADRYLEIGGFILFDDSSDDSDWEVCRVIDEIKKVGKYEVVMHNPNYLVKKIG